MGTVYKFRPGFHSKVPADVIHERIQYLKEQTNSDVIPAHVFVEDARPPGSPLHDHFTWDDHKAAEERREDQARYLVRCYVYYEEEDPDQTPIIANVRVTDHEGISGYTSMDTAMKNPVYKEQVFREIQRLLEGIEKRLRNIQGAETIIELVSKAKTAAAVASVQAIPNRRKPAPVKVQQSV